MRRLPVYILTLLLITGARLGSQTTLVFGTIISGKTGRPLPGVSVKMEGVNTGAVSSSDGSYAMRCGRGGVRLIFRHVACLPQVKDLVARTDSLYLPVTLFEKQIPLDTVAVRARPKPDTLVHSGRFSIYDFDFFEDKFILLTAERGLDKSELRLATYDDRILHTVKVPKEAGAAKEFFHDFMGFTNLVCEHGIYRVIVYNNTLLTFPIGTDSFNQSIKPVADSLKGRLYYSDNWPDYPLFNYFSYNPADSSRRKLITITNQRLLDAYNFEYYFMKPSDMLAARRLAEDYHTDKHIIAAMMTGFTKSMLYEPLYAPLFVVNDTVCVFDHYRDLLFHFSANGQKLDSVPISYNHPRNWHEWKRQMVMDDAENRVYAIYNRNGRKYLRRIGHRDGKDKGRYDIQFHSADKIKIRNGYIYYVYRPFESTQEKFLYRELITLAEGK